MQNEKYEYIAVLRSKRTLFSAFKNCILNREYFRISKAISWEIILNVYVTFSVKIITIFLYYCKGYSYRSTSHRRRLASNSLQIDYSMNRFNIAVKLHFMDTVYNVETNRA